MVSTVATVTQYPGTAPCEDDDRVSYCSIEEDLVDGRATRVTNGLQDHGVVERKTIVSAVFC